jgi:hypothetical protein
VIKLNSELEPQWTTLTLGTARIYDGGNGEDKAVSIARDIATGDLFVTGTSASASNGKDIVTLRLKGDTGAYADGTGEWPPITGQSGGRRRWDNPTVHGDDSAAEIGVLNFAGGDGGYTAAYIVGTSDWGSTNHDDIQVLAYGRDGKITGSPGEGWATNINGGASGDDTGTGILRVNSEGLNAVLACGYGEGTQDIDFLAARLDSNDGSVDRSYSYDFQGDDYCLDMAETGGPNFNDASIWLVGRSEGTSQKAATVVLQWSDGSLLGQEVFQYIPGGDAAFNAIHVTPTGLGPWAVGRARSSATDTDTLVIRYVLADDPTTLNHDWILRSPPGTEVGYDEASCIAVDGAALDVFCGGVTSPTSTYGQDFLTLRITD